LRFDFSGDAMGGWVWPTVILLSLVLLAVAGGVVWHKCLSEHVLPKNFGVTLPGRVYRSARLTPSAVRSVHRATGIRTIVDLAGGPDSPPREKEKAMISRLGIERFPIAGLGGSGDGDAESFVRALEIIADPDRHPVLFHCAAGANRTTTADVFFRHLAMGQSLEEASAPARKHGCDLAERDKHMGYIRETLPLVRQSAERGGWLGRFAGGDDAPGERYGCWKWFAVYLGICRGT
jgi:protein tyrosine/serine phosphatase